MDRSNLGAQTTSSRNVTLRPFHLPWIGGVSCSMEDELDNLGDQPLEQQHTANQLICDLLVKPKIHQNLPNTLAEQIPLEHHLMRTYA